MIVVVKEYSPKTGKGIAVDQDGREIPFTYKQFQGEKMIPVGRVADLEDRILSEAKQVKSVLFFVLKIASKLKKFLKGA